MFFESCFHILKAGFKNRSQWDAHIPAEQHKLARDWEAREINLLDQMLTQIKTNKYALHKLARDLASEEAYAFRTKNKQFWERFRSHFLMIEDYLDGALSSAHERKGE